MTENPSGMFESIFSISTNTHTHTHIPIQMANTYYGELHVLNLALLHTKMMVLLNYKEFSLYIVVYNKTHDNLDYL